MIGQANLKKECNLRLCEWPVATSLLKKAKIIVTECASDCDILTLACWVVYRHKPSFANTWHPKTVACFKTKNICYGVCQRFVKFSLWHVQLVLSTSLVFLIPSHPKTVTCSKSGQNVSKQELGFMNDNPWQTRQ